MTLSRKFIWTTFFWMTSLILIGFALGMITKGSIPDWYEHLNRSSLTPPNYVFGFAWSFLYALIGVSGSLIWDAENVRDVGGLKRLYISQLLLNWSWTPVFFGLHATGLALVLLMALVVSVGLLIYRSYAQMRTVSLLLVPYFAWLVFAGYLNFFTWFYN